ASVGTTRRSLAVPTRPESLLPLLGAPMLGGVVGGALSARAPPARLAPAAPAARQARAANAAPGRAPRASCAPSALGLGLAGPISPQTGEDAGAFALTNRSSRSCLLHGYPRVSMLGAGGRVL